MGRWSRSIDKRMLYGTGKLMKKIYVESSSSAVLEEARDAITIEEYEPMASYSWKDIEHPTIYVPGVPPLLTLPTLPIQLKKDKLTRSTPRSPAASIDPLFQALLHQCPNFSLVPIELVSDRNSLRNILTFASSGRIPGNAKWRVDVDMIHDTMFFSQWEEFRVMLINGGQDSGYGHAFEDCVTERDPALQDSIHHERIVRYALGGLQCLVRFEADAYLDMNVDAGEGETGNEKRKGKQLELEEDPPAPQPSAPVLKPPYKLVHVVSRGHAINASLIAEIKSCSSSKKSVTKKTLPQLWFSQTKHLCVGYHQDGLVTSQPETKDMTDELEEWEGGNQEHLRNMVRVIEEIREVARSLPPSKRRMTIVCKVVDGVRCLGVFQRRGDGIVIRKEVMQRCWRDVTL